MARRLHNSGFTLLELVLVMLILAVGAALAAPSLAGFSRGRRLPNTAQEFVTTAHWCRAEAASDGIIYHLNVDSAAGRWWVTKDDGSGTNFVAPTNQLMQIDFTVPEGIQIATDLRPSSTDGLTYISFSPDGRSDVTTVRFSSDNSVVNVVSDTPLGSYHIAPQVTQ